MEGEAGSKADSVLLWADRHRQTSAKEIGNGTCASETYGSEISGRGIYESGSEAPHPICATGIGIFVSVTCASETFGRGICVSGIYESGSEAPHPTGATGIETGTGTETGTGATCEIAVYPPVTYGTPCATEGGLHLCTAEEGHR